MTAIIEGYRASIEEISQRWFEKHTKNLRIEEPVHYILASGGKKLRGCFALALYEDLGGDPRDILPAALALELLHAASLIHDDLPALDDDDMRRGKPALHRAFDEATAILTADYLIAASFGLLSDCRLPTGQHDLSKLFSEAFCHLCEGQLIDTIHRDTCDSLVLLHQYKTGALFRCTAGTGAQIVREDSYLYENIKEFGLWIGVGFQILDDLIDSNPSLKGRERSSDKDNEKNTYASEEISRLTGDVELTRMRLQQYYTSIHEYSKKSFPRMQAVLSLTFKNSEVLSEIFSPS